MTAEIIRLPVPKSKAGADFDRMVVASESLVGSAIDFYTALGREGRKRIPPGEFRRVMRAIWAAHDAIDIFAARHGGRP